MERSAWVGGMLVVCVGGRKIRKPSGGKQGKTVGTKLGTVENRPTEVVLQ